MKMPFDFCLFRTTKIHFIISHFLGTVLPFRKKLQIIQIQMLHNCCKQSFMAVASLSLTEYLHKYWSSGQAGRCQGLNIDNVMTTVVKSTKFSSPVRAFIRNWKGWPVKQGHGTCGLCCSITTVCVVVSVNK